MDTKTDISSVNSFSAFLKDTGVALKSVQWFPPLPERFSVRQVIQEINSAPLPALLTSATTLPLRMLRYPGIALASVALSLTNPLDINYSSSPFNFLAKQQDVPGQTEYQSLGLPSEIMYQKMYLQL